VQAEETRSAIVRAARDLFIEQGYGRTTMADIAAAAGVSVETIYAAFSNKATLLHKAWDITVGGDDQDIVFHERPEVLAIRNEADLAKRLILLVWMTVMAAEAAKTGQVAVSEEECRDVLWSMTDGMLWHRLVNQRGWTTERFAEWLGRGWVCLLVQS